MNELPIKMLTEIINNMNKILTEKKDKHKDSWESCELMYLRLEIKNRANKLFSMTRIKLSIDEELRQLTHIFNYAFFLYYRLKQESFKPFKLT